MFLHLAGCALLLHIGAATHGGDEVSLLSTHLQVHKRSSGRGREASADAPVASGLPLLQEGQGGRRTPAFPSFEVDLDLPPRERWQSFYRSHREAILERNAQEIADIPVELAKTTWFDNIRFDGYEEYLEELRGIVEVMDHPNISLHSILWGEFSYERGDTLGCTAVLAANANGSVFHGRNLDLQKGAALVPELLDVTFMRGGRPLILATTFIGTVGISTGYRIGSYSVAQNTRIGAQDQETSQAAARNGAQTFSLAVRRTLEEVPDFAMAVHTLATKDLIAPMYFTLAGTRPYEGALITRDRKGSPEPYGNVQALSPLIGRWFIAQTNDDIQHPPKDLRRGTANARLHQMRQDDIDQDHVLSVMMSVPVLNLGTVFTWVCEPATGSRLLKTGKDELLEDADQILPAFTMGG